MKNFVHFERVDDYKTFVRHSLIKTDRIRNNPFYSGLMNWIIDHRTPLYFYKSDDIEHFHFSQYFGGHLLRDYDNPTIGDMYMIHDWVHRLFYYPLHPQAMTYHEFQALCIANENTSSAETELLTYALRDPGMRPLMFDFPILYDVLQSKGFSSWDIDSVTELRRLLGTSNVLWDLIWDFKGIKQIKEYMSHQVSNEVWCALWYQLVPRISVRPFYHVKPNFLNYHNYADVVTGYRSTLTQSRYEMQMTSTVEYLYALVTGKQSYHRFEDVQGMLAEMDGKIAVPDAARLYHEIAAHGYVRY